ncbi:Histidine kinase internal region [Desulfovibrio sp. DV]|uniref:LytS/YhcK type 5TM receptor domain-containing protein n=1 Tax=Desulfovibrio sp. DV TaxID=1844708 RepID=UPI00095CEFF4|nr:LytS/YhcK type 5TM receptor domain-containing protein [Desulfovibrio sp. DV]OLN29314.1 Histidine kinase internal region [Desulfovibrio sp. DV]
MNLDILVPEVPGLFINLSQRFGLLLAGGFAIMTMAPFERMGLGQKRPAWTTAAVTVLFGVFGILGTYTGNSVFHSYANLRAMGVITAGLFGGPVVGIGAGLIAGGHRYLIDIAGFSALPCALATFLEGTVAGLIARRFPGQSLDWGVAMALGLVGESFHMGLVLALARPFDEAIALVQVIGAPMIVINAMGAAIFVRALRLQRNLREHQDSTEARRILSIASQTVPHLRSGLTPQSARATAAIILVETGVAAVAITGESTILAHVGAGQDHHLAGAPWRTRATRRSFESGTALFLRDRASIGCAKADCPLREAIIVPLRKGTTICGCLKLYGTKDRPLDQPLFELAKGLADLFSTQLELEDIGIKNQLLAHAEIRRLQAQINPHFLFNSLNTIASFCRTAPGQARELLLDLARYMRRNLDSSRGLVRLSEEMEQIHSYLAIEQARFGERIKSAIDVEPGCADWLIPPLLIQPLVENSVRHGLQARPEGGQVRVTARFAGGHLEVVVEDDGLGMAPETIGLILSPTAPESLGEGVGARNSNQRLVQLFGQDYAMRIESAPGQGARIAFRVPPAAPPRPGQDADARKSQESRESPDSRDAHAAGESREPVSARP